MKHIESELIQKYIDNESSQEEIASIIKHLSNCAECRNAVDEQRMLASEIRDTINLLGEEIVEIPVFNRQVKEKKKNRVMLRWRISAASVACFLLLMIFVFKPAQDAPIDFETFFHYAENEFDANRSIVQQEIVVTMIDSNGNISKFNL